MLRREDGHVLRREDGHVLRREDGHVLRKVLDFEAAGRKRLKRTRKRQVEEKSMKVGLNKEDALCQLRRIRTPSLVGHTARL